MMRGEALLINGIFESVLNDILQTQQYLRDQILYLQPYSGDAIVHLRDAPPSLDDPVRLYATITTDLPTVHFVGEIVGWEDKRELTPGRRAILQRVITSLQSTEKLGLYDAPEADAPSVNLLHVRRLLRLQTPFGVQKLVKTVDNTPVSPGRRTAGGWTYVKDAGVPAV